MKSCKQCDEYDVCSRQNDLRRKKPRCPKAKVDKPMTNHDRLISKTPEEMVEWIESIEPAACPWRDDHGDNCRFTHCRECWLSWLKSPVEVDNGT